MTPEVAQQRSALLCGLIECAAGEYCVNGLVCCTDPCGGLCGVVGLGNCDDGNPCTQNDSCSTGQCIGTLLSGNSCDAGMVCDQGACVVGCWLNNARIDAGVQEGCLRCDPRRSANSWSIATDAGCDDGNACTLADRCDATGACVGTGTVLCGQEVCHELSACDPQTGQCDDPEPLVDGVSCDGDHYCVGGSCTPSCNIDGGVVLAGTFKPGNPCKQCDPEVDSTTWTALSNTPCDDGNACSLSSTCSAGSCLAVDLVSCAAVDACHVAGVCDPLTGSCSSPLADAGTACDDGLACTVNDGCIGGKCAGNGAGCGCLKADDCPPPEPCHVLSGCLGNQCIYVTDDSASCSDQNACTTGDRCFAGECVSSAEVLCSATEACAAFGCDATSGDCVKYLLKNGTPCAGGLCLDGACAGGDAGVPGDGGSSSDAGVSVDGGSSPDAGTPSDGGSSALAPVSFVTSGCSSSGAFSLVAFGVLLLFRRRF